jgi:hypothetical protein
VSRRGYIIDRDGWAWNPRAFDHFHTYTKTCPPETCQTVLTTIRLTRGLIRGKDWRARVNPDTKLVIDFTTR